MVTQAQILDVATFIEFKEVARLANGGDPIAAYRCWMRGVEILHSPFIVRPYHFWVGKVPSHLRGAVLTAPMPPLRTPLWQLQVPVGGAEVSSVRQGHGLAMVGIIIDGPCVLVALLGAQWKHRMWHPHSRYGFHLRRAGRCGLEGWKDPGAEFSSAGGLWHSFSICRPQLLREHCMTFYASSSFRVET